MDNKKKKVLYLMRYPLYEEFNLKLKFDGQLSALQKDYDVYYFALDKEYFYLMNENKKEIIGPAHFGIPNYIHTVFYFDLHKYMMKIMKTMKFDFVYWRDAPCWCSSYCVAKKMKRSGTKIMYEFPTYPASSEKSLSFARQLFSYYAKIWYNKVMKYPDVFVFTGDATFDKFYGKPAVNIDNGINVQSLPIRTPVMDEKNIHILALASMSYWHGYDRLIRSLYEYKGDESIIIHMVGGYDGGSLTEWENLVKELKLEDKVIIHGLLYGDDLNKMFDLCDVGVNSLALYRKGFVKTSELKVREYAARGLPFICAVEDPAIEFMEEPKWMFVDNDDSIPNMQEIVDFVKNLRNDEEHPKKLRDYAKEHMSWEAQFEKIFSSMEE